MSTPNKQDRESVLSTLKHWQRTLPGGEWTYATMGSVWVGKLKKNTGFCARGAGKDAYCLFEIDPDDLFDMSEEEAEEVAGSAMEGIVELRNLLPQIIKLLEVSGE